MNVVRIYDDRKVFYNNVDLASLCNDGVMVEYCTLQNREPIRIIIDKSDKTNDVLVDNWDFENDNNYCVFLDTRWDKKLIKKSEKIEDINLPLGLITQIEDTCVCKVIVYTLYDKTEGQQLVDALKRNDKLISRLKNQPLTFATSEPNEIIRDVKKELY